MNVSELTTRAARACGRGDNLRRAAQIMWENDCGVVPVVDDDRRAVGMLTNRDVCTAARTRGRSRKFTVADLRGSTRHDCPNGIPQGGHAAAAG